jgi:microcystin-dependent protein
MSQPYIGEIRLFAGNFPPQGWAFCNGQLLPITGNEALFNLIGTTYGGDGITTFALPDLQGRVPIHLGQGIGLQNYSLGSTLGSEVATPQTQAPQSFLVQRNLAVNIANTVDADGSGSKLNRLGVSFILSLFGIFPAQN